MGQVVVTESGSAVNRVEAERSRKYKAPPLNNSITLYIIKLALSAF